MLELAGIFGGSFVLALSGVLMPGPILTITVAESVRRGAKAGPLIIIGHGLIELFLVVAIIQGLGAYLKRPLIMTIIASLGGAILLWFGLDMLRTAGRLSLKTNQPNQQRKATRHPIIMGVLASLSNPYWTLWWATVGLGYLVAALKVGFAGVFAFFAGHVSADFGWYSFVSFGISRGKTLLTDRSYQILIRICGVFLMAFGVWFLASTRGYIAALTW